MGNSNVLQVPDYEAYLVMEYRQLLTRYLCAERDLGNKRMEYAQVLSDEKDRKAALWNRAVDTGESATKADKISEHGSAMMVRESITLRAEVDVLEREAALLLFLMREIK